MGKIFKNRMFISVSLSVVLTFAFVYAVVYGATTISTSIDTGGSLTVSGATSLSSATLSTTLTVTGVSTLTDDLAVDTDTLYVDVSTDRTGVGTTTPSAMFSVGEAAGSVSGDVYMTGGLTVGATSTINSIEGTILFPKTRTGDPTGTEGLIYYNSTSKVLKMHDGTSWFTVGTSTSGLTLSAPRLQLADMGYYLAFGTTTQQGLSVLTVEATSTAAIPLTIVGYTSQTANLLQVNNSASANLFYINASGNVFATGTLQVTGAARLYGALTVDGNITAGDAVGDTLTVNAGTVAMGNRATTTISNAMVNAWSIATSTSITPILTIDTANGVRGRVGIGTVAPSYTLDVTGTTSATSLIVGGGTSVSRVLHGICNLASYAAISATSTGWHECVVAGVTSADRVIIQLPRSDSTFGGLYVAAARASSTATYIGADIFNLTGIATSSYAQATTSVQYWIFK